MAYNITCGIVNHSCAKADIGTFINTFLSSNFSHAVMINSSWVQTNTRLSRIFFYVVEKGT